MRGGHSAAKPANAGRLAAFDTGRDDTVLQEWRTRALAMEAAVGDAVIGQAEPIRLINIALFARGHVLLEGDVGVCKKTVLRAFSRAVGGKFERVEGTVDMMPGDLLYHTQVDAEGRPRIDPGPLLRHGEELVTFLFNKINRARPQVQSLLLRAMAERTVSAFNREYRFPHMTVFADRNRIEREETFALASAARDRFLFEVRMTTPASREVRRALALDPAFHDPDALVDRVEAGMLPWNEMNTVAALVQRRVPPPVDEENVPEFTPPPVPAPVRGVVMGVGSLTPQPIPRSDSSGRFIGWWEADDVVQRSRSEDAPDSQEHLSALHERQLQALARVTGLSSDPCAAQR